MERVEAKIISLLDKRFSEEEFKDCFLVEIKCSKKKLQVFIDSDEGLSYRNCVRFSRYLEEYLDESQAMGSDYTLDVSSPGTENAIKNIRQLPKHIGRKFRIVMGDEPDVPFEGTLKSIVDEVLEIEIKEKKKESVTRKINFKDIHEIKVVVSF